MKAATDNAGNVIAELKLVYNKTRQAAITKELSKLWLAQQRSKRTYFGANNMAQANVNAGVQERLFSVSAPWWTWSFRVTRCPVYDALKMDGSALTLEVQQQLGDGIVRTIALGSSDGLRRGMIVKNTETPSPCLWAKATWVASWTCWARPSTSVVLLTKL